MLRIWNCKNKVEEGYLDNNINVIEGDWIGPVELKCVCS